jgi:hypothetical protein
MEMGATRALFRFSPAVTAQNESVSLGVMLLRVAGACHSMAFPARTLAKICRDAYHGCPSHFHPVARASMAEVGAEVTEIHDIGKPDPEIGHGVQGFCLECVWREEQIVLLVIRGTRTAAEWKANWEYGFEEHCGTQVHSGFLSMWKPLAAQVLGLFRGQRSASRWVLAGNSRGGAMLGIASLELDALLRELAADSGSTDVASASASSAESSTSDDWVDVAPLPSIELHTFSSPRAGGSRFVARVEAIVSKWHRWAVGYDFVACIPPTICSYRHGGTSRWLPDLSDSTEPQDSTPSLVGAGMRFLKWKTFSGVPSPFEDHNIDYLVEWFDRQHAKGKFYD